MNKELEQSAQNIFDGPLGKPPPATSAMTTKTMKSNRPKNTRPEIKMRKALFNSGIRGYRIHWDKVPGRPDIAFPGRRLSVFVYGCYWHRCPYCNLPLPKSNSEFWQKKFLLNQRRDVKKRDELLDCGWHVIEIWECQIKNQIDECVSKVKRALA